MIIKTHLNRRYEQVKAGPGRKGAARHHYHHHHHHTLYSNKTVAATIKEKNSKM